jgi:hypothetical protein
MMLGVVGPHDSVKEAKGYVVQTGLPIKTLSLPYNRFTEVPGILQTHQKEVDALLFTGVIPYTYAMNFVKQICPWHVVPKDKLSLIFALLKAGFVQHYDITKISIDSYADLVTEAYKELHYNTKNVSILVAPEDVFEKNYIDNVINFHTSAFEKGKAKCAFTGMEIVYKTLVRKNIPCMMVKKVFDSVLQEVNRLLLYGKETDVKSEKYIEMDVGIEYLEEHPAFNNNLIQVLNFRNKIMNDIYLFAQSVDAAVFEDSRNLYYLCTGSKKIIRETNNYQNITLLKSLKQVEIVRRVYIAIGEGITALSAQEHARVALEHAKKLDCDGAFVMDENQRMFGPIVSSEQVDEKNKLEKDFAIISRQSGVSIQCINKLYYLIKRYGLETVTTKKIAELYGGSKRNVNRILAKLEDAGYVQVLGKELTIQAGRPSRIIKIKI